MPVRTWPLPIEARRGGAPRPNGPAPSDTVGAHRCAAGAEAPAPATTSTSAPREKPTATSRLTHRGLTDAARRRPAVTRLPAWPFASSVPTSSSGRTRPHEPEEAPRHVAELSELAGFAHTRANIWRYEPGAKGRRHRHKLQEETFVVLAGTLSMYLGDPPERQDVPTGGLIHVEPGTPLQTVNHGTRSSWSTPTAPARERARRDPRLRPVALVGGRVDGTRLGAFANVKTWRASRAQKTLS